MIQEPIANSACHFQQNILAHMAEKGPAPRVVGMLLALERIADDVAQTGSARAVVPAMDGIDTHEYAEIACRAGEQLGGAYLSEMGIDLFKAKAGKMLLGDVDLRLKYS